MLLIAVCLVVALPPLSLVLLGFWSRRIPPRDPDPGRPALAACPASPNCISSIPAPDRPALPPLRYRGPADTARRRLVAILQEFPRTRIVTDAGPYLHATFQSRFFGFVDDVEFLFEDQAGRIDFRSGSRVGYSDFGANKRRMEEIHRRFAADAT
jgi:uncharacterized protein (DUF1499 family)